jgi:pantoate--beta-alanine ligase
MSSRNAHLSGSDRERAAALHRALDSIRSAIAAGERDPAAARARALAELTADGVEPEYLELVAPDTLAPLSAIDGEAILALIAARVGPTRLIDNELIQPLSTAKAAGSNQKGRT